MAQNHSAEGLMEMMLEVQQLVTAALEAKETPNWHQIKQIVAMSEPPNIDELPHVCAWVQKYGGGKKGQFTEEISECSGFASPQTG